MIAVALGALLTLGQVEEAAVAHAPSVRAARATVDEDRALLDGARATGLPHAVANYNQQPQAANDGSTISQRLMTLSGQLSLSDLASRNATVRAAQATLDAALANEMDAERAERIKAIGLYVDLAKTTSLRRQSEVSLSATRDDRRAAVLRYSVGDAPRLDIVRADVALASARADLACPAAAQVSAREALVVEIDDPSVDIAAIPNAFDSVAVPLDSQAAVDDALAHRPEIAAARAQLAAARAGIASARATTLPAVVAQVGYATGFDTGLRVNGPAANVTVDLPLSGALRSSTIVAAQARVAEAQAKYDAVVQAISLEVRDALTSIAAEMQAVRATALARNEASNEVAATLVGYREGAASSLELVDARRSFANAIAADVQARAALFKAIQTYQFEEGASP